MKQQIIKTDAILTTEVLKQIEELQEENNTDIENTCRECNNISRWLRKERDFFLRNPELSIETILNYCDTLDYIYDVFQNFAVKASEE
jgi:hypothetical protein